MDSVLSSPRRILDRYAVIFNAASDMTPFDRCAGLIAAAIDLGLHEHDDIVRTVPKAEPAYSYKFVAFVLGQLTGSVSGLWRRDRHRRYYLH